jgi:N-acetylglucosamine-6-sulfatase
VRTKDFKLIFFYGLPLDAPGARVAATRPGWELYDLRKDPEEARNVYGQPTYAKVVEELKAELLRLKAEIGDTDDGYPDLLAIRKRYW